VDSAVTTRSVGLDLGATDVKLVVLEGDRVIATDTAPTRSEDGPDAVLARLVELGLGAGPADAVGVAVPGQVDRDGNALFLPNLHGDWAGVPIVEPLADGLAVPVAVLNDGHAFALAETRIGAARGAQDVVCIVCGTGVGGGLVLGGRLHLGIDDRGGEVGHMTVDLRLREPRLR
jgi:predicted NBD/HSP70 family sugar kinase